MLSMAAIWRRRFGVVLAVSVLAVALGSGGCSTFREKPGHSPYRTSHASKADRKKKSSSNPLSAVGSMFKKEEPKLAQSPGDFVGMPRPEW